MVDGDLNTYGALAAALAKAQSSFPPISRDRKVTVETRTGGSYTFKYAPLDTIIAAVRGPLSDNGLALAQLLDGDDLVTMLMHKDGQTLTGRMPLPRTDGGTIQALGSAITYLRRYSIQAILGIAAEEDDDGNRAAGNIVRDRAASGETIENGANDGSLIGTVVAGKPPCDLQLRQTPQGPIAGFKLAQGRSGLQVLAEGNLAHVLQPFLEGLVDQRVSVWGHVEMVPWQRDGKEMPPYKRLMLTKIRTADWELPGSTPMAHESGGPEDEGESIPLFDEPDEAEKAAILAAEKAEAEAVA